MVLESAIDSSKTRTRILANAEELRRLHARIGETFQVRSRSQEDWQAWERACADFRYRYDPLAFPGGYNSAPERILAGDRAATEAALCFLECRPYFFRSGYMFKKLLRRIKRAELSAEQQARLYAVLERQRAWQARKRIVRS